MRPNTIPIVVAPRFVLSIRDSGYKSVGHALAELIDNSFEAEAENVAIQIDLESNFPTISITDDGLGMKPGILGCALQFGGSTRFNSRSGSGRYGFGLPNASLSVARRVEVVSWTTHTNAWKVVLDLDEIGPEFGSEILQPKKLRPRPSSPSGTRITWTKCDQLVPGMRRSSIDEAGRYLAQTFRKWICTGKRISINGNRLQPLDPLMLDRGSKVKAKPFGPELRYQLRVGSTERLSEIRVVFSCLPLNASKRFTSKEKLELGITRHAGVSVIRGKREIDYGWFFLDGKRRENYDDWWRCEITFEPELDELFGVTNTKQGIRPSRTLKEMLQPDIQGIARDLNALIRKHFTTEPGLTRATSIAERHEVQLEPLNHSPKSLNTVGRLGKRKLQYKIRSRGSRNATDGSFFEPGFEDEYLSLIIMEDHPFIANTLHQVREKRESSETAIHLMLLAASRAETSLRLQGIDWQILRLYRSEWGRVLASFCD